jgi:4-amino-4-deoxy-L-arabinose transferase-like glycosyltransferase
LPTALAGIALIGLTMLFGSLMLGGATATLGAALLLTTFSFAENARRAQLDVVLALFETLALAAFWHPDRRIGRRWVGQLVLHASMGLAILTKGPVGFLVPLLVMVGFLGWERRLRDLRHAFPWWGLFVSLGPALAWIVAAVALAPPGFFGDAIVDNLFGRFFAGSSHPRPFYYYLYQFPAETLPWFLLAPAVWWAARRGVFVADGSDEERRAWRFLLAWVAATLLFFSLSTGKRGLYLLPLLPAVALLIADALGRWVEAAHRIPVAFHVATGFVGAALAAAGGFVALRDPLQNEAASLVAGCAVIAIVAAAVLAQLALWRARARLRLRLAIPVIAVWALLLVIFSVAYPAFDPEKSPRAIAEAAAALTPEGEPIGLVGSVQMAGGLVYYGDRRIASLRDSDDIERFLADGGRAIVVEEKKRDRVDAVAPVEVRFRARSGRRAVLVVAPQESPR